MAPRLLPADGARRVDPLPPEAFFFCVCVLSACCVLTTASEQAIKAVAVDKDLTKATLGGISTHIGTMDLNLHEQWHDHLAQALKELVANGKLQQQGASYVIVNGVAPSSGAAGDATAPAPASKKGAAKKGKKAASPARGRSPAAKKKEASPVEVAAGPVPDEAKPKNAKPAAKKATKKAASPKRSPSPRRAASPKKEASPQKEASPAK